MQPDGFELWDPLRLDERHRLKPPDFSPGSDTFLHHFFFFYFNSRLFSVGVK